MKLLWMFIFLVCSSILVHGQQYVEKDNSQVELRLLDSKAIEDFKNQDEFKYQDLKEPVISLWDRFWSWFWYKVEQLLKTRQGKNTLWVLFIVFGSAMIFFFVLKVTGMNKGGLFGRKSSNGLQYSIASDDINNISFDEAIAEATSKGNYRLAVRLLYLQALKKMSDKGFINWQINKTNTDYISEVASTKWQPAFKGLTESFEYTWYGETFISNETYAKLHQQFQQFNSQL